MRRIFTYLLIILSFNMQLKELDKKLFEAIKEGNFEEAKALIKKGADINSRKENGLSPLHQAIWAKKKDIAIYLISNGADVNTKVDKDKGSTPLLDAAATFDKEIVELLVSKGAQIGERDSIGNTALHNAAAMDKKDVAEYFVSIGMNINDNNNTMGYTPLHWAIEGYCKDVIKLFISKGADVTIEDRKGYSPLELAAQKGLFEFILSLGIDINLQNKKGETLLHYYTGLDPNEDMVNLLLSKGANPNIQDKIGNTPIYGTAWRCSKKIANILLTNHANIRVKNKYGATPLHWAALVGCEEVAEILLLKGADVNARTEKIIDLNEVAKLMYPEWQPRRADVIVIATNKQQNKQKLLEPPSKRATPLDLAERIDSKKLMALLEKNGGKRSKELK